MERNLAGRIKTNPEKVSKYVFFFKETEKNKLYELIHRKAVQVGRGQ